MDKWRQEIHEVVTAYLEEFESKNIADLQTNYRINLDDSAKHKLLQYICNKYDIPSITEAEEDRIFTFDHLYDFVDSALKRKTSNINQPDTPTLSPDEEKNIIRPLLAKGLEVGKPYYLLDSKWLNLWKRYVMYEDQYLSVADQRPGPIDNRPLLLDEMDTNGPIKQGLMETYDYLILCEEAWCYFIKWYGGGPAIVRKSIALQSYMNTKEVQVEVHLLAIDITYSEDSTPTPRRFYFSKQTTIAEVKKVVCEKMNWEASSIKVYQTLAMMPKYRELPAEKTLNDYFFLQDAVLYFELENGASSTSKRTSMELEGGAERTKAKISDDEGEPAGGAMSRNNNDARVFTLSRNPSQRTRIDPTTSTFGAGTDYSTNSTSRYSSSSFSSSNYYNRPSSTKGLCGLRNLGNTCFMNSGIQCLSNTYELTNYFLTKKYVGQINRDNPLGMKGQIAEGYAELIQEMWSGNNSSVAPVDFKRVLGTYAPQFSGYQQQDSQELLAFLLDGLHEDLNRVINKEYVELKESDGKDDVANAAEAWKLHLKRNNSIIVDLFQGQYKSKLVCPQCGKISITFDPYLFLSVPVPIKSGKTISFVFISVEGEPIRYAVQVEGNASIADLKQKICEITGVKEDKNLRVSEVYTRKFHKHFKDQESVKSIQPADEIFVFELMDQRACIIPVLQKSSSSTSTYGYSYNNIGYPFFLSCKSKLIDCEETCQDIWKRLRHFVPTVTEYSNNLFEVKLLDKNDNLVRKLDVGQVELQVGQTIVVEWNSQTYRNVFDEKRAKSEIPHHSSYQQWETVKAQYTLEDCLSAWSAEERLSAKDPWYCPKCKEFREATKKLDLFKLPKVLIFHLKRFSYESRYYRDKIDAMVDFPFSDLDLSHHALGPQDEPPIYDLFAVSNHYGSLGGGHYTAYAKNHITGKWYDFDDSSVTETSLSHVKSKDAYVLFYVRRTPNNNNTSNINMMETENLKNEESNDEMVE